jgi:hypothetical protein
MMRPSSSCAFSVSFCRQPLNFSCSQIETQHGVDWVSAVSLYSMTEPVEKQDKVQPGMKGKQLDLTGCRQCCTAAGATHQLGRLDHELEGHDAAALGVLIVAAVLQADQIIVTASGWQLYVCLLTTYANSKQKCPSRNVMCVRTGVRWTTGQH